VLCLHGVREGVDVEPEPGHLRGVVEQARELRGAPPRVGVDAHAQRGLGALGEPAEREDEAQALPVQVRRELHVVRQARQPPRRRGEVGADEGAQGVLELEDGLGGGVEDEV
jgi:hypothetical protein